MLCQLCCIVLYIYCIIFAFASCINSSKLERVFISTPSQVLCCVSVKLHGIVVVNAIFHAIVSTDKKQDKEKQPQKVQNTFYFALFKYTVKTRV